MAGQWAPRIARAALEASGWSCGGAEEPFDYECCRIPFGRPCYRIKVVSGEKAFNSTMQRAVERAGARPGSPCIILTLQGYWQGSHERDLGPCKWLDAVATWRWITGDPKAYKRFLDTLYQTLRPYRRVLQERVNQLRMKR
jgi:hypothetical protein